MTININGKTVKFLKFCVKDFDGNNVRVHYSLDNRCDERACVTIYAKDYSGHLYPIFGDKIINNTDLMSDYFEKDRIVIFSDSVFYSEIRAFVEGLRK